MISEYGADTNQQCENKTPSEVNLIVCHQFPDIEFVSPICISSGTENYSSPDQKIVSGSKMQINFKVIHSYEGSSAVLMYKLQRKNIDQSNIDAISSEEEATCTLFVIVWEIDSSEKFSTTSYLIECDEDCAQNRDKLLQITEHYKPVNIQHGFIEDTWLIHDNKVLMTSLNITPEKGYYKLEMTISETSIRDDTQRLRYFKMDR
jgi:hypothetical protein